MVGQIFQTIEVTAPVILLIALGMVIRHKEIITTSGLHEVKRLIVSVALPAVFFQAFLTMDLDGRFTTLYALVLVICFALLLLGYLMRRVTPEGPARETIPFLMTGFEFGMLGISLFGTVWGMENIGIISVIGLPHEFFIWFVFVTVLARNYGAKKTVSATIQSFVQSPIIVAIFSGIALNIAGLATPISQALVGRAILRTFELTGAIVGPLILFVIGHGLRVRWSTLRAAAPVILVRGTLMVTLALVLGPLLTGLLDLPPLFEPALFTFLILPPPFVIPLYIPEGYAKDSEHATVVLSGYTLFSVIAFVTYVTLSAPL